MACGTRPSDNHNYTDAAAAAAVALVTGSPMRSRRRIRIGSKIYGRNVSGCSSLHGRHCNTKSFVGQRLVTALCAGVCARQLDKAGSQPHKIPAVAVDFHHHVPLEFTVGSAVLPAPCRTNGRTDRVTYAERL